MLNEFIVLHDYKQPFVLRKDAIVTIFNRPKSYNKVVIRTVDGNEVFCDEEYREVLRKLI